jgi:SNF2 family DNA or RNA helicase
VDNLLPQFFLRRMKSLIAHQLPKKTDKVVFCALSDIQKDAYERFLESDWVELVRTSGEPCDCESGKTKGHCCYQTIPGTDTNWKVSSFFLVLVERMANNEQTLVFPIIITLQKLSNHLALLIPRTSDPRDKQDREIEMLQTMVPDRWEELYTNRDSILSLSNPEFCGKVFNSDIFSSHDANN